MTAVGIEALNVYGGCARVPVAAIFEGRGLDPGRFGNLMMESRAVSMPFEDPVTNAVNAARPVVEALAIRDRIEILLVATESGLDYSKSIASYVHAYLGLGRHCRLLETKQACYSATAALQLAVAYVASGVSPGARVLVIATDVALADAEAGYAEPATGSGAVALLVGPEPRVFTVDSGAFGLYSFETLDTARPGPELEIADVDRSLLAYLECLAQSFAAYRARVVDADFVTTFDYLAMHTPFAGMVRAGHRRLMRELTEVRGPAIDADFDRRVAPSLVYPGIVGNIFAGSLYLGLASLVEHAPIDGGRRVGLFSYGSGCSSEFFSGTVSPGSRRALAGLRIRERLARRRELTFPEYEKLLALNQGCLVPRRSLTIDVDAYAGQYDPAAAGGSLLALTAVEEYHRRYAWI